MKKFVCLTTLLLAVYLLSYVLLTGANYIHITGGVGLGGNGYQIEGYWIDSTGKPMFYTAGKAVLYLFRPCWEVECMIKRQHRIQSSAKALHRMTAPPRGLAIRESRIGRLR
jgi:hypothetical protein